MGTRTFSCVCAQGHLVLTRLADISKVRSVNLDTWLPEQLAVMQSVGNANARLIYEATLPANYPRPTAFTGTGCVSPLEVHCGPHPLTPPSELLQWIKDKYEYGRWKAKPAAPAPVDKAAAGAAAVASPARKRRPKKAAATATADDAPGAEEP